LKTTKNPHLGKWVYCYMPDVGCAVRIHGESVNYWIVELPGEQVMEERRVLKAACTTNPTTRVKAVRNPR
jgi:hypothetical protein